MAQVRDLLNLIEEIAPHRLAEEWDNCGLMVGRPDQQIHKIALAMDPTVRTIQSAAQARAQVLLTHHPLIFKPLKNMNLENPVCTNLALALQLDLTVIAAHTNLDAAREGVSWVLAEQLGLEDPEILKPLQEAASHKLVTFVPIGYEDRVKTALFGAGAGQMGLYQGCSFAGRGEGTYIPEPVTRPFQGAPGRPQRVAETRLEVLTPAGHLDRVVSALLKAHPYQSVAYDIYPLSSQGEGVGFGCLGYLKKPLYINELISIIKEKLEVKYCRVASPPFKTVQKIAVLGGSGGGFLALAKARGAEVLVSGDLGYHHAREAEQMSLCLVDAGHFATERPVLKALAEKLRLSAGSRSLDLDFFILPDEQDPWSLMEV